MNKFILLISLLSIFSGASTTFGRETETRKLAPFTSVKVYGRFDVIMVKGNEEKIELESRDADLQKVLTEVEKGKLRIRMKTNYYADTEVKIVITFRQVNEIIASAGAVVDAGTVDAEEMIIRANSGSTISAEVNATELKSEITQGATLKLSGKVFYHECHISTGGQADAYYLTSTDSKVRLSMGGYAKIYVKGKLDASVTMGGNISFKGGPKEVKQSTSFGGSITEVRE